MNAATGSAETTLDDMELIRAKTAHLLSAPEHLPISYVYGGEKVSGILSRFRPTMTSRRIDANIIERVYEGTHDGLRIRVESYEYLDNPVVDWTAWFENVGDRNTPILSDILGLDASFEGTSPVLYHCNGDFYSETGYTPEETALSPGDSLGYAPVGGRPCDQAFPYYRVSFDGFGLTLAIGWPAQWSAQFDGTQDGVRIQAGQEITNLYLEPGERIRTPRMTVMAWTGDMSRGINVWRRWYLEHVLPRHDGQPLAPYLTTVMNDADVPSDEFTKTDEKKQLAHIQAFAEKGFDLDVWWIDAGWYPSVDTQGKVRWGFTGDWRPDPARFPNGLRPISDAAAENGADLLVWFEPERVQRGSWIEREHPEWVLKVEGDDNCCLNLGDAETCQAFTDYICRTIQENGIKVYRQDYNFAPLKFWRGNDADDRQGIRENLHVQGYLRYWDALIERNPGLWIDSCSSGGRRNDLETMRRSVPLHYTDYGYGLQHVKAGFHYTLYAWLPYFKEFTLSSDSELDSYSIHCGMGPMLMPIIPIYSDDCDFAYLRKMMAMWRRASTLLLHGDYFALTPFSNRDDAWTVRQFERPELGVGLLHGMRHKSATAESMTVHPEVLHPESDYIFENPEAGATMELSGAALQHGGFTFSLPARSAAMWFYRVRD